MSGDLITILGVGVVLAGMILTSNHGLLLDMRNGGAAGWFQSEILLATWPIPSGRDTSFANSIA